MMHTQARLSRRLLAASLTMFVLVAAFGTAIAGPARYDPKTRSFRITYTYAALPSWGMTPDQIESLGELQEATPDQDSKIRALHAAVSKILEDISDGRARISSLDYVNNIKKADVIISLTGNFQRAGWSTQGTTDGRPGQVGLYYLYLDTIPVEDVVYTMAHELSHYLFGLPDEYNLSTNQPVCPEQNPSSPGCLMDNYFLRHGYRKICRDSDHNADGPRMNAGTILQGTRAEDSCQLRIDGFFKDHPPGPEADLDGDGVPDSRAGANESAISPDQPFTGKFRQVVNSATMAVRDRFHAESANGAKKKPLQPDLNRFKQYAKQFLDTQLKELSGDPDFATPTKDQITQAIEVVAQTVFSDKVSAPAKFNKDVLAQLKLKARELAGTTTRPGGDFLKRLFDSSSTSARLKELKPVIDKVTKGLKDFIATAGMKRLIGLAPTDSTNTVLDPQTTRYIEQIARDAVIGSGGTTEFSSFLEAAKLHIRLNLNSTQTLNAIASELDLPGPELRRLDLNDLETKLDKFRLPGKPFTGFGFRRTYVVAPHPLDPKFDRVRLDAGDNFFYHDIRNLTATQFMRLIQRERTEFVNDPLTSDPITTVRLDALLGDTLNLGAGLARALDRPGGGGRAVALPTTAELASALGPNERFAKQQGLITKLVEEVRRDRVENIVILAPPGGISQQLDDILEEFRALVLDHANVRVDVVLSEQGTIPLRLRDLVAQSGGSVQMGIDLDELGAVAQRLKNEVAAGSWVARPQKGYIDFSTNAASAVAPAGPRPADATNLTFDDIRKCYLENKGKYGNPEFDKISMEFSILDAIDKDIQEFERQIDDVIQYTSKNSRPASFDSVTSTLAGLSQLRLRIEEMDRDLDQICRDAGKPSTHRQIHALYDKVFIAKQSLRELFGSRVLLRSPLTSTDDYMDWCLRKLLVQRAGVIDQDYKRSNLFQKINAPVTGSDGKLDETKLGPLREYTDDLIQGADQIRSLSSSDVEDVEKVNHVTLSNFMGSKDEKYPKLQMAIKPLGLFGKLKVFKDQATLVNWIRERKQPDPSEVKYIPLPNGANTVESRAMIDFESWHEQVIGSYYLGSIDKTLGQELALLSESFRRVSTKNQKLSDSTKILSQATDLYTSEESDFISQLLNTTVSYSWEKDSLGSANSKLLLTSSPNSVAVSILGGSASHITLAGLADLAVKLADLNTKLADLNTKRDELAKKRLKLGELRDYVDRLEREESLLNPDAGPLLLRASEIKIRSLLPIEHPYALIHASIVRILEVARLLERASQQPIDTLEFSNQFAELSRYVANIQTRTQQDAVENDASNPREKNTTNPSAAKRSPTDYSKEIKKTRAENAKRGLEEYKDLLNTLKQRKESSLGRKGTRSSLEDDEEELPRTNGLTPLFEGLQSKRDLEETLNELERRPKDTPASAGVVRQRVQNLVYLKFPLLMLDILGRLRQFEDDIQALERGLHGDQILPPTFQRLNRKQTVQRPDLEAARDGHLLEIAFDPFQAEDGAEIELILGLSRPLRKFDELRNDPEVKLRLSQGDHLIERPYLRFDPDVSTETMLVYRVPRPYLKAGLIGKGEYTPSLLIARKYLPILSRENTINYTFSVGTPRPNVQLIAGLRQPQPKEGDREFGKDKKEDAYRGTILSNASEAIAEVQVLAGAPVIRADVTGQFQWIDESSKTIDSPTVDFVDSGVYPDMKKDDGIYTARITLQPAALRTPAEYRIYIQAKWTKDCKFIPLAEPIVAPNQEKKQEPDPPPVPEFQRSTSLNFRVSGET